MTLTTEQKIQIVQAILDDPEKLSSIGICALIDDYLNNIYCTYKDVQEDFGLTKYKPEGASPEGKWFPFNQDGAIKRIEVLRCVLQDLQEELLTNK